MRFNNRACALMDIPDLPQGAFEHIGNGKIKPQGGGGGFIGDFVDNTLGSAGDFVENTVSSAGDFVGAQLQEIVDDPGKAGAKLFAVASGNAWALPLIEGIDTIEEGGTIGEGLLSAGKSYVGQQVGAELGSQFGGGGYGTGEDFNMGASLGDAAAAAAAEFGTALPYTEAFDAYNLAQQGLSSTQIAQNLTTTGLDSYLAEDMARLAANGLSPDQIVQTLSYSYTPAELAGTGIESKALGLPSKGLTAGQALQGIRLASGLLGQRQQQPQMQMPQMQIAQTRPSGAVDYSGLLNLLSPRMAVRNPNSLLG